MVTQVFFITQQFSSDLFASQARCYSFSSNISLSQKFFFPSLIATCRWLKKTSEKPKNYIIYYWDKSIYILQGMATLRSPIAIHLILKLSIFFFSNDKNKVFLNTAQDTFWSRLNIKAKFSEIFHLYNDKLDN